MDSATVPEQRPKRKNKEKRDVIFFLYFTL